ncbi:DNA mismatch repair protein MutS [Paracoccus sp. YIM 132242]|uniref:DNA mismatch repair protein MutS n=1 Tax=Paracoccus lichenicola TaxID=2665644 RepID=A0A6L6HQK1_9RHOB|nr:Smr/MutS family protein [Paracoccus lichenicola]MTE00689.1 DNA mismatch repair protein MutS [Paracoccus lichenicola]
MARRRDLTPEDRDLWARVARTAAPMHPERPRLADPEASPSFKPKPAPPPSLSLLDFAIGHKAPPRPPAALSAAPTPAQRLAQHPLRMDHKVHRRMAQGKLAPEARLDLHGLTLAAAHPELTGFILSCHAQGRRLVLVITGKGRGDHGPLPTRPGALRHQVPHWLHMPPLSAVVQQVTPAHYRHGGEGAYYVYLRRSG